MHDSVWNNVVIYTYKARAVINLLRNTLPPYFCNALSINLILCNFALEIVYSKVSSGNSVNTVNKIDAILSASDIIFIK